MLSSLPVTSSFGNCTIKALFRRRRLKHDILTSSGVTAFSFRFSNWLYRVGFGTRLWRTASFAKAITNHRFFVSNRRISRLQRARGFIRHTAGPGCVFQACTAVNYRFVGADNYLPAPSRRTLEQLLSVLTGQAVSVRFVPAYALTRFARHREEAQEGSRFAKGHSREVLRALEQEIASRFRRPQGRSGQFIRNAYRAIYLKNATVLARFRASTLRSLPRHQKETTYRRFLRKSLQVFVRLRPERRGARLRFAGRVNRWNRTKTRDESHGSLPLSSLTSCRDFGRAEARTRKGILSLRLWLSYTPLFAVSLRSTRSEYILASSSFPQRFSAF